MMLVSNFFTIDIEKLDNKYYFESNFLLAQGIIFIAVKFIKTIAYHFFL